MKKCISIFLMSVILINLVFPIGVKADVPNKDILINKIDYTAGLLNGVLDDLTIYSNTYDTDIINVLSKDAVIGMLDVYNNEDFTPMVEVFINELRIANYTDASNSLDALKSDINEALLSFNETFDYLNNYLNYYRNRGFVTDILDIFNEVNTSARTILPKVKNLLKIYFQDNEDNIESRINSVFSGMNTSDINLHIASLKTGVSTNRDLIDDMNHRLDIFNELFDHYGLGSTLEIFVTDLIKTELNDINDYTDHYMEYIQNILKDIMIGEVDDILSLVDETDLASVTAANQALYDQLEYVDNIYDNLYEAIEVLGSVSISGEINYVNDIAYQIDLYYEEVSDYIIEHIHNDLEISSSLNTVTFDSFAQSITVNQKSLLMNNFFNSLDINNDNCSIEVGHSYNYKGNIYIGTGTVVDVILNSMTVKSYVVIVKGDIMKSGTINSVDLAQMAYDLVGISNDWDSLSRVSADMNDDDRINSIDLALLANLLVE